MNWLIDIDKSLFRQFYGSDSAVADIIMLDITTWWVWIPFYLFCIVILMKNKENSVKVFTILAFAILCFAITEIIADVVLKPLVGRLRPCYEPSLADLFQQYSIGYHPRGYSFCSAHAANMCGVACYLALLFRNRTATIFLSIWAFLCCYSRIYLGAHYPIDVIVGAMIGVGVAFLCNYLMSMFEKRNSLSSRYVSRSLTSTGYLLTDIYAMIILLQLTYIVIIIHSVISA